ncbi:MAG: hypothetical protein K2N38_09740 [Oscillospiraceae bacterium]|nr:hypothetical protein [Oscillospiraceae bacterium]
MTRDEIKKLFPEATDEQVSALLSSHHSEMLPQKSESSGAALCGSLKISFHL